MFTSEPVKEHFDIQRQLGESGLVGSYVVIRIGRFPVQTPLGTRPGLGTQLCGEAPSDLWIEIVKMQ